MILKGGEFLVKEVEANDIFIPEEFDEEQKMIIETCEDFLETEIFSNLDRIDAMEPGLMRNLISKAGELGILGISIPEEYEGFDQSFVTSMRVNEAVGSAYSYSVAFMAHTGIGTLPILYYGNEEQKQKYVTKLATGEWAAAYCLTEPNAGSDVNAGKTKAVLSDDGKHYILNGTKMWITNGGFAEIQTVFAKIENDRVLSAFIVEKDTPGININAEERKMGIKGSSTVQIFYTDVKVPVENLLGKRGEGFRIALNILHIGRIKLGGTVLGAAKRAITQSVNYANERKQFGTFISNFGAIKYKLAEQVIRTFSAESAVYRASKYIDDTILELTNNGMEKGKANIESIASYSIEASMLKVLGSEVLDFVVDETAQIFGGMGFSAEAPADRAYRDSRINRIFEGTNEINRLWIADTTIKKSLKGEYDLSGPGKEILDNLDKTCKNIVIPEGYYKEKIEYVKNFKKIALMIIRSVSEKFKNQLVKEQEILFNISDIMTHIYATESTILRVQKLESLKAKDAIKVYKDIIDVLVYDAAGLVKKSAMDAVNSHEEGKLQSSLLNAVDCLTRVAPVNVKEARRRIADVLIEDNKYNF